MAVQIDARFVIVGVLLVFLLLVILFRKKLKGLVSDLIDALLSFADILLGGAGLFGGDVGDLLAALWIYSREWKVVGEIPALFVVWEATNFLPLSFIPIVGEVIEFITNLIPMATIMRFLFAKYKPATKAMKTLDERIKAGDTLGADVKKYKKTLEMAKEQYDRDAPVPALRMSRRAIVRVTDDIIQALNGYLVSVNKLVGKMEEGLEEIPEEEAETLEESIEEVKNLVGQTKYAAQSEDFEAAATLAVNAVNKTNVAYNKFKDLTGER